MKKLVLIVCLFITSLFAHSQTPIEFGGENNKLDTISTKQIKTVPITLQNLNDYEQQYYIEVDGVFIGLTNILRTNQIIKLNVPVKISKENQLEVHKICTVSVPKEEDELFKTKICTKAYLYWIKN